MAKKEEIIAEIRPIEIKKMAIKIVGDTPLIVHAWSEKAKREMLESQTRSTKTKAKECRRPFMDYVDSMYWLTEKPDAETDELLEKEYLKVIDKAQFGFPIGAIKEAGNSAAYRLGWFKNQMALRGSYFLSSPFGEMGEIKGDKPKMREDMVRIGMGTADLRYRGEFKNWYMDLILEYNANGTMTIDQILNVLNAGGYSCGIGEWRPEKDGRNGMYHIEQA